MSADDLQVRVIIDNGCDTDAKPRPRLMSLAEAIKAAIDLDNRDIMALSLDQEIPVLRIDRLNSFRYKQSKRVATKSVTKKQLEKEFRFNAGIEENDLKRKVETISETLEKGATCIVSIRCKNWALRNDPDIVKTTANRVLDGLKGVAELMNDVKIVGDGTRAQFRLRPAK
jgi:translation initiation factor IF-3